MNKIKMLVSVVIATMLLMVVMVSVTYGQGEGPVDGSFTIANVAPTVGEPGIAPDPMTPQEEWTQVTVPVTDLNYLADVDEVHVEVFFDDAAPFTPPGAADAQTGDL